MENKIHLKAVSGLIKPRVEEDKSLLKKLNIFEKNYPEGNIEGIEKTYD